MLPSRDGIGTPRFGGASELYAQGDSNPCSLRGRLLYRQADGQELFHKSPLPFWLMRQCDVAVRSLISSAVCIGLSDRSVSAHTTSMQLRQTVYATHPKTPADLA